jgi:hypothetical protein
MPAESSSEPLDLQQFLEAAEAAVDDENGFDLDDVLAIEEAWELEDDESVAHGYIVALRSGDRLYVEYRTVPDDDDEAELTIVPLDAEMERPDLEHLGQSVKWYTPDHITTHLYTLRPEGGTEDADS